MKPFVFAAALVPSVLVAIVSASVAHADDLPALPEPAVTAAPTVTAAPSVTLVPAAPAATTPPPAAAQPVAAPSTPTLVARRRAETEGEEAPREWYGYQTLVVDLAGIGMTAGAAGGGYPLAIAGLATYVVGGPIVHAAHGHGAKVAIDLGIRLGAPTVGGLTGILLGCAGGCSGDLGGLAGAIGGAFGAGLGVVTAIVIDSAVLAREPAEQGKESAKWDGKPIVRPEVTSLPGGGAVGVGGAF
ncbi:MAG: hypothetical protein IPK71_15780 [Myxococcales bacterium]|nr:hypothetical protein [Myxococcales bacterium]